MTVVRYEPKTAVRRFEDELGRFLTPWWQDFGIDDEHHGGWCPAVDVKEEPDHFLVVADIPGVEPEKIEVTMEDNVLTIKGERKSESKEERAGYTRMERVSGSFYRRMTLPRSADGEGVVAKSHNGVLEITIPKISKAKSRTIKVHA